MATKFYDERGGCLKPADLGEKSVKAIWKRTSFLAVLGFVAATGSTAADVPNEKTSWNDIVTDGESLVFGRFVGKFESPEFQSRRLRIREIESGEERTLEVDEGLGYIAETVPPGTYHMVSVEAVYFPRVHPFKPGKYRPIKQRFGVRPKTGDAAAAIVVVPQDRPVYIGTIEAGAALDGVIYKGQQLRVFDDFDDALERLESFYPNLTESMNRNGVAPARHFMLKPTPRVDALDRVVGLEDPIRQARRYIADRKFEQARSWLETFMPTTDVERSEVRLLIGEALLGDRRYPEAIHELGEVLLASPRETRALRLLARAHAFNGDLDDAENLYEALTESVPDDAEAHLHLGYLYALKDEKDRAEDQFIAAFQTDYDYLLHDVAPFFLAMKRVADEDSSHFEPPRVVRYRTPPPDGMGSRRSGQSQFIAVLIDHHGKVVAAQMSKSSDSTPMMMMSLVNATYQPASLNGIPVPSLLTIGSLTPVQ